MRSRERTGWFSGGLGLAMFLLTACFPATSGAVLIDDAQVKAQAGGQGFKLTFAYASDAAYTTARTAACARQGVPCATLAEGALYYRTIDNVVRYYDGAAWQTYAPGAGAGATLDDVYGSGQTITRDTSEIRVNDATNDASITMNLHRTAGSGAVLNLDNTGTGNDITGDLWSIDTSGAWTGQGLTMGDDDLLTLGDAADFTLEWDTLVGTDGVLVTAADSTPVYWGSDAHGLDQYWYADAGAGVLCHFDASGQLFDCDGITFHFDDSSTLYFGTGDDFTLAYDGSKLLIQGAAGDDVAFGEDGLGHDVVHYGSIAGQQCAFDYNNATSGDALVCDGYDIWLKDDDLIVFGDALDATITWNGTTLLFDDAAGGDSPVTLGDSTNGLDLVLNSSATAVNVRWDASAESLLFQGATGADAKFGVGSNIYLGTVAGAPTDGYVVTGTSTLLNIDPVVAAGGNAVVVGSSGKDVDLVLWGENAGGADGAEVSWDYSADMLTLASSAQVLVSDDVEVLWGTQGGAGDVSQRWVTGLAADPAGKTDALQFANIPATNESAHWGIDGEGLNLVFWSETAGDYIWFDQATSTLKTIDSNIWLEDGTSTTDALMFGSGGGGVADAAIFYNGVSNYVLFDPGLLGVDFIFGDAVGAQFGDLFWTGAAGKTAEFSAARSDLELKNIDLVMGVGESILVGATDVTAPVDGILLEGDTTNLYVSSPGAASAIKFGSTSAPAKDDIDVVFNTANGEVTLDHGTDTTTYDDVDVIFQDAVKFGTAAAYIGFVYAAGELGIGTGGIADRVLQIGASAANQNITTYFGAPATAAIGIYGSATAPTINYVGAFPVRKVFIPASAFGTELGAWTRGTQAGSSFGGAYATKDGDATDDVLQYYWQPPAWVHTGVNITGRIIFANGEAACVTSLQMDEAMFDMEAAVGGRSQLDVLAKTTTELDTTTPGNTWEIAKTANFTIPHADVDPSGRYPIYLAIVYEDDDAQQACVASDTIIGVELDVTQNEIAE